MVPPGLAPESKPGLCGIGWYPYHSWECVFDRLVWLIMVCKFEHMRRGFMIDTTSAFSDIISRGLVKSHCGEQFLGVMTLYMTSAVSWWRFSTGWQYDGLPSHLFTSASLTLRFSSEQHTTLTTTTSANHYSERTDISLWVYSYGHFGVATLGFEKFIRPNWLYESKGDWELRLKRVSQVQQSVAWRHLKPSGGCRPKHRLFAGTLILCITRRGRRLETSSMQLTIVMHVTGKWKRRSGIDHPMWPDQVRPVAHTHLMCIQL